MVDFVGCKIHVASPSSAELIFLHAPYHRAGGLLGVIFSIHPDCEKKKKRWRTSKQSSSMEEVEGGVGGPRFLSPGVFNP